MSSHVTYDEVRSVLLRDWDPLGVGDNPNLSDEYDSYIPELLRLLRAGASATVIAEYLETLESRLGVDTSAGKGMEIAVRLLRASPGGA